MKLRELVRGAFDMAIPKSVRQARTRSVLLRRARQLARHSAGVSQPLGLWRLLQAYPEFIALQRESEILGLLELAREIAPWRLCEIGTAAGGTAFLLARIATQGATLITIDLALQPGQAEALAILGGRGCRVVALTGDSHDEQMAARVRLLAGGPLDVLFIDGDHRYEGVVSDYELFRGLVRPGGIVAFHDIVPDSRSRGGPETGTDAGDVPRFWEELRSRFPAAASEIIESPTQDACGIGVLRIAP